MARKDVIQVRVSEEEKKQLGELAAKAGSNVSDFVRSRALEEALGDGGTPPEKSAVVHGRPPASPRAALDEPEWKAQLQIGRRFGPVPKGQS